MTAVRYAPWPKRAAGLLIDIAVLIPLALVTAFVSSGKVQVWCVLANVALFVLNRWVLPIWNGRSIGRAAMSIRLVGVKSHKPIHFVSVVERDVAHFLDTLSLGIGWIRPLWQDQHQTIADSLVDSTVILAD
jgi:Mce-associated membrane protein